MVVFNGLEETFAPDLHTGTGNLSVPIALPMGRAGLKPELTLVYSHMDRERPIRSGVGAQRARCFPRYGEAGSSLR